MTEKRLISALRDYAALARRRRVSYAEQINHLLQLRLQAIADSGMPAKKLEEENARLRSMAAREYGKYDDAFIE